MRHENDTIICAVIKLMIIIEIEGQPLLDSSTVRAGCVGVSHCMVVSFVIEI